MANQFSIRPPSLQGFGQIAQAFGKKDMQNQAEEKKLAELNKQKAGASQAMQFLNQANASQDPAEKENLFMQAYKASPEFTKGLMQNMKARAETEKLNQPDPQQQGTGQMSGYAFNPTDGTFKINPELEKSLNEKAAAKLAEGKILSVKDRQGINKDVTALLADSVGINKTAKDLQKLGKLGGGPASIALVFKFMKALDPQSVVRESEFATAENSAGVPESVRNIYNKIKNGEKLGDAQIKQFIDTANVLANSAADSSSREIGKYLDVYEYAITESLKEKYMGRIPSHIGESEKTVIDTEKDTTPSPAPIQLSPSASKYLEL